MVRFSSASTVLVCQLNSLFEPVITVFIRSALAENIRLDGRRIDEHREVSIHLERTESASYADVSIGTTRAVAAIRGEVCKPYPDRPTEGILSISSESSNLAQQSGTSHTEITRMLERAIRDSDAIDTESLCIISGQKVWMLVCDVRIIDYAGSAIDACMLAVMSALRAFRRVYFSHLWARLCRRLILLRNPHYEVQSSPPNSILFQFAKSLDWRSSF